MIALIDMDMITWRCGFASEKKRWIVGGELYPPGMSETKIRAEMKLSGKNPDNFTWEAVYEADPVEYALGRCKMFINEILQSIGTTAYKGFLGTENDTTLFRHRLAKTLPYKGNRKDFKKPEHYKAIREYLLNYYNTEMVSGIESDDAMAMYQNDNTVICSNDKDMKQVPGKHFNPVTGDKYEISTDEASYNFWKQVLTGDKTDNIPGLFRIGDSRANKILSPYTTDTSRYKAVQKAYKELSKKENWQEYLEEQASLVYLLRGEDDYWRAPV